MKAAIPKPKVAGTGRVLYRCAACDQMMEPRDAVLVQGRSYHPEHVPESNDGR